MRDTPGNDIASTMASTIANLIQQESLPDDFDATVRQYFLPLAERIQRLQQAQGRPVVIGINGAQGTGKSTLALFLETLLSQHLGCPSARFSIDDIYLTRAEREALAVSVHPLFRTRGVPGTHDVELGNTLIDQLQAADESSQVSIPVFDKSVDDRAPASQWRQHKGKVGVILLEGWCVGAIPQPDQSLLKSPINSLESNEDSQGLWRQYVNQQLEQQYQALFGRLDYLVMLKAPSMECILEWRTLQEQKLAEKVAKHHNGASASGVMTPEQIQRFIMHYERLTRFMLEEMPQRANALYAIDEQHRITGVRYCD